MSNSTTAEARRRVLAKLPTAPDSNRSTAAVASTTSAPGGTTGSSRTETAADDRRLADEPSREVVEMGGLLDDLPATDGLAQPPRRRRRAGKPARGDEPGRVPGETLADLGHRLEGSQVIADGDDEPALLDAGRDSGRALCVSRRQRLLSEERDAALDELLADRHRRRGRDADVRDVGTLLVEQARDVVISGDPAGPGGRFARSRSSTMRLRPAPSARVDPAQRGEPV